MKVVRFLVDTNSVAALRYWLTAMHPDDANNTVTGRLFAKYANEGRYGIDFATFVRGRRASGKWTEFELALSIKDRISLSDIRFEDVQRDMRKVL